MSSKVVGASMRWSEKRPYPVDLRINGAPHRFEVATLGDVVDAVQAQARTVQRYESVGHDGS